MIEIRNLSKSYNGKIIFNNLSSDIKTGECTAFMGQSGIGKTTLLRCIAGLETADSGSIRGMENMKKSFVFQENRLLPHLSVLQNILCVTDDKDKALHYLEKTFLIDDKSKKCSQLSGGMKRRLAIAKALAFGGDFFYLDEPLRELDEDTNEKIMQLLKQEIKGKTSILITHDINHAHFLADRHIFFRGLPMEIEKDVAL
ncbi:MAG: ABC transporter ATP-binding protein [Clostridia bacterium]|nr:ABC transporter ATP-binding protein [Clostridia bacterium]